MKLEQDPKLIKAIELLKVPADRNPQAAARGRARFLAQAATLAPAVSTGKKQRLMGWMTVSRKGKITMNAVIAVVVAIVMLLGGSATVYAAQDDLPTEALYPVKIFTEDAQLWMNTNAEVEVDMLMALVEKRVQEMVAMTALGVVPPAEAAQRLNLHIENALQTAAEMDDAAMQGALLKIQTSLQTQQQVMTILQTQSSGETSQLMAQIQTMLETRIRMVDSGIVDPQGFRNTVRAELQPQGAPTDAGNGPGPQGSGTPSGKGNAGEGGENQGEGGGDPLHTPTGGGNPDPVKTPGPKGPGGSGGNKP